MGVQLPSEPINRKEQYLAKIAGQAVEIPAEPITREEAYLDEIAKNGSGGGGGTTNYNLLSNKPQIAGTELKGNKSLADLGIASATELGNVANAVIAITDGQAINSFSDVETALADKVDKENGKGLSTNDYDDTEKAQVATNKGDITSLKSGLTNVESALSVPEGTGKNVLPMTLAHLKELNTNGTWVDNVYTYKSVAFTVVTDAGGIVTSISANGTATDGEGKLYLANNDDLKQYAGKSFVLNGCTGGSNTTYMVQVNKYNGTNQAYSYNGDSNPFTPTADINYACIVVRENVKVTDQVFYPMMRFADITDATFAPHIPSVESRLETVETVLPTKQNATDNSLATTDKTVVGAINELKSNLTISHDQFKYVIGYDNRNMLDYSKLVKGTQSDPNRGTRCSTRDDTSIKIDAGTTITVSRVSSNIQYAIGVYDVTTGDVLYDSGWKQSSSTTWVLEYGGYIRLTFCNQDSTTNISKDDVIAASFQLVIGTSTAVTPYRPSIGSRIEQNDINLEVPNRKNVLPSTLAIIKAANTNGTWTDNVYSYNGVDYTVNTNADGYVTSITAANAATTASSSAIYIPMPKDNNKYLFNGGVDAEHNIIIWDATANARAKKWDGSTNSDQSEGSTLLEVKNVSDHNLTLRCRVSSGVEATSKVFYPMVCPSITTDTTFETYIPSVESRLESVESGLTALDTKMQRWGKFSTTASKWYHIGYISKNSLGFQRHRFIIAFNGNLLKGVTLRCTDTDGYDNNDTKIDQIFGTSNYLGLIVSADKLRVDIYITSGVATGAQTYQVLTEGGENPSVVFNDPTLTDLTDADMTKVG